MPDAAQGETSRHEGVRGEEITGETRRSLCFAPAVELAAPAGSEHVARQRALIIVSDDLVRGIVLAVLPREPVMVARRKSCRRRRLLMSQHNSLMF